jgi:hypothetical protein
MSDFNDFDEYYRSLSDRQIAEILNDNADKYQPAALEAARKILEQRGLDENAIEKLKEELTTEQKPPKSFVNILNRSTTKFEEPEENSEHILPLNIRVKKSQIERILIVLNGLWVFFGLYFLYTFSLNFLNTIENFIYHPLTAFFEVAAIVIMSVAVVKFILRKSWGWILLIFNCIASIPASLLNLYNFFQLFINNQEIGMFSFRFYYRFTLVILGFLLIAFTIYSLVREDCMKIFNVTKRKKQSTITVSIFFALFVIYFLRSIY